MWNNVGMGRNKKGLETAINDIEALREAFWNDVNVVGSASDLNMELERAGRIADFLELGELIARDALHRNESCGGHFREEYQTEDGEAKRDDKKFSYVAAWEYTGNVSKPTLNKEPLEFEYVKPAQRSYK
jgi:succinate dehydrogenase / fumarate reductase flavoprotein subunit